MHHHINHCWCSSTEHDGKTYDAPNMVEINRLESDEDDWDKLIDIKQMTCKEKLEMFERMIKINPDRYAHMDVEQMTLEDCPCLKSEVVEWLNENIKVQKNGETSWAIGNDEYRIIQNHQITLWFQRRNDAKKFIKVWSIYKKATSYFNYLADPIVNLVLDIKTNKYRNRHDS